MTTIYVPDFNTTSTINYDTDTTQIVNGHTDGKTYKMPLNGNNLVKIDYISSNVSYIVFRIYDSSNALLFDVKTNVRNSFVEFNLPTGDDYFLVLAGGSNSSNNTVKFNVNYKALQTSVKLKVTDKLGLVSSVVVTHIIKERGCNKPILFEHLSGDLPKGLVLQENGFIVGKIDELDCYDVSNSSASIDNYDGDEHTSKARVFEFEFGAWLKGAKQSTYKKDKGTICVYNNWSLDTNDFLDKVNFSTYDKENTADEQEESAELDDKEINCICVDEIMAKYTEEKLIEIKSCYTPVNVLNEIKINCDGSLQTNLDNKISLICGCDEVISEELETIDIKCNCDEIEVIKKVDKKDISTYAIQNVDDVNKLLSIKQCRNVNR